MLVRISIAIGVLLLGAAVAYVTHEKKWPVIWLWIKAHWVHLFVGLGALLGSGWALSRRREMTADRVLVDLTKAQEKRLDEMRTALVAKADEAKAREEALEKEGLLLSDNETKTHDEIANMDAQQIADEFNKL